MEEIKRREKRVGTYTFGVVLILIGIAVLIMTFTKIDVVKYIFMFWPVVLIGLGIEIIYLNSKSDIKVKVDFFSIILMCIVLFFTAIFSVGNYFVNKVLYDEDVKSLIINEYAQNEYCRNMNKEITIQAAQKNKVKVTFMESKGYDKSSFVEIRYQYKLDEKTKLVDVINTRKNVYQLITNSTINIGTLPDYVEKVQITIFGNDAKDIHYDGEVEKINNDIEIY